MSENTKIFEKKDLETVGTYLQEEGFQTQIIDVPELNVPMLLCGIENGLNTSISATKLSAQGVGEVCLLQFYTSFSPVFNEDLDRDIQLILDQVNANQLLGNLTVFSRTVVAKTVLVCDPNAFDKAAILRTFALYRLQLQHFFVVFNRFIEGEIDRDAAIAACGL